LFIEEAEQLHDGYKYDVGCVGETCRSVRVLYLKNGRLQFDAGCQYIPLQKIVMPFAVLQKVNPLQPSGYCTYRPV
jgi:hypothetical protein